MQIYRAAAKAVLAAARCLANKDCFRNPLNSRVARPI